jgi:mannitol operon repressor
MNDTAPPPPPHVAKFIPYFESLNKESERSTVLVSSSYLDDLLRQLLEVFFVEVKESKELLDESRPLGSFSSRITASYCCGLISEVEHKDCHIIRTIRNDFAHRVEASFQDQSIRDRCKNLSYPSKHVAYDTQKEVELSPHAHFTMAAVNLNAAISNRILQLANRRLTLQNW